MVDMIGDPERGLTNMEKLLDNHPRAVPSAAERRLKDAMALLCPQHPNKHGMLILRAAMGWARNSEIVLCEVHRDKQHLRDEWEKYTVPQPPHWPDPQKIRQLFLDGMLKRRKGPPGLFMLYHRDEKSAP